MSEERAEIEQKTIPEELVELIEHRRWKDLARNKEKWPEPTVAAPAVAQC